MGKKQRIVFVTLIALVMVIALVSAFSLSLFHETPAVVLPSLSPTPSGGALPGDDPAGDFQRLEVTVDTVQAVIATLDRPESYTRTVTAELLEDGAPRGALTARVNVDGGWTQVEADLPDGRVSHSLIGEGARYVWYGSETAFRQYAADDHSADLAQRLPTYEDVLAADKRDIRSAAFEVKDGLPCIRVEVAVPELGYLESYWISVDNGLLVAAESAKGDAVFYRVTSSAVETPAAPGLRFSLPDGVLMHTTTHQDETAG